MRTCAKCKTAQEQEWKQREKQIEEMEQRRLLRASDHLVPKDPVTVFFKSAFGLKLALSGLVPSLTTVEDMKRMVQARDLGITCDQQRLVYAGKFLQDYQFLSDYNIGERSMVYATMILPGR